MRRYGTPAQLETGDETLQRSANISIPGSAPGQPELAEQEAQQYISQQAEAPIPEAVGAESDGKQKRRATFVAEIIRQLADQDQEPVRASSADLSQLRPVV